MRLSDLLIPSPFAVKQHAPIDGGQTWRLLLLAIWGASLSACGNSGTTLVAASPPSKLPICLTTRCSQIFESIGFDKAQYFPVFQPVSGQPAQTPLVNAFIEKAKPDLLVLPKGLKASDYQAGPKPTTLSGPGFANLFKDVSVLSVEVGKDREGAEVVTRLRDRLAGEPRVLDRYRKAIWIGGSKVAGEFFLNEAVEGTDEAELMLQFFDPVLDSQKPDFILSDLIVIDPPVIFFTNILGDEGLPSSVVSDPRWHGLTAVKNGHVFVMPTNDGQGFGPGDYESFLDSLDTLH
jgi:hypothetical protein